MQLLFTIRLSNNSQPVSLSSYPAVLIPLSTIPSELLNVHNQARDLKPQGGVLQLIQGPLSFEAALTLLLKYVLTLFTIFLSKERRLPWETK